MPRPPPPRPQFVPPPTDEPLHPLICPVCDYNLHGLPGNVCPECGSAFDPDVLSDPARGGGLRWLFEHGPRPSPLRYIRTLARSLVFGGLWRAVSPADPVRPGRLTVYWLVGLAVAAVLVCVGQAVIFDTLGLLWVYPGPRPRFEFTLDVFTYQALRVFRRTVVPLWPLALWVPLTPLALSLFRQTLRRRGLRAGQLWRVAVYSNDVLLPCAVVMTLATPTVAAAVQWSLGVGMPFPTSGWVYAAVTAAIPVLFLLLAGVRAAAAARTYLRNQRLTAEIALSQVTVTLLILVLLIWSGYGHTVMMNRWHSF